MSAYVISVMARDRVGIVADVTQALARLGGSIDAMSQTVMRGYFTIIITARFPERVKAKSILAAVAAAGEPGELEVSIKEWEEEAADKPVLEDTETFVLSVLGPDRPGIIARLSSFLQSRNINIIDLWAYVSRGQLIFISQVQIERSLDIGQLQIDLENLFKKTGLSVSLQHENIFLATNKVEFQPGPSAFAAGRND